MRLFDLLKLHDVELSILIVGNHRMRSLNRSFRGIDRTTDVLSFPQYGPEEISKVKKASGHIVLGDIVINPYRIERQALENNLPLKQEMRFILIHGLLHLLGYDHEKDEDSKLRMERLQRRLLNALEKMDHQS